MGIPVMRSQATELVGPPQRAAKLALPVSGQRQLAGLLLVALVALLTVVPIGFVVVNGFNVASPGRPFTWGIQGWIDVFSAPRTLTALLYSAIFSIRAPIAVGFAFLIAWLLIRVQIPGRSFIEFTLWVAYFLPAMPVTLGWILLLDPSFGLINNVLKQLPFPIGPVDIRSIGGILWVHLTIATVPAMTMLLVPAFRMMDASLEEASRACGATNWQTLRRITLPLLFPALATALLAGLIRGLEAFEIEQLLGTRVGVYVYATRIFDLINFDSPQFAQAMALSTLSLTLLLVLAVLYQRVVGTRNYATISGKSMTVRPLLVGRWRYLASAVLYTYIAIGIVLPLALLLLGSFMQLFGFFTIEQPFTLTHWKTVLESSVFTLAVRNSLLVGIGASLIGLLFYTLLGYVLARSNLRGRRAIGLMVWLPWAVPGMLLSVAILWMVLSVPLINALHGTIGALIMALLLKELPLGVNLSNVAFLQVGRELEQSSRVCGANWLTTYRRIMLPLIAPMLVSIATITFIGALRDIGTTILLVTPQTRALSHLMFQFAMGGRMESAACIGIIITGLAVVMALLVRRLGLRMSLA